VRMTLRNYSPLNIMDLARNSRSGANLNHRCGESIVSRDRPTYGNSSTRATTRKLTFRVILAAVAADLGDETWWHRL
jgi:hypothetical protein